MTARRYRVTLAGRELEVALDDGRVMVGGRELALDLEPGDPEGERRLRVAGRSHTVISRQVAGRLLLSLDGVAVDAVVEDELALRLATFGSGRARSTGLERVVAPMPGLVVQVTAEVGQAVGAGESLVVLQAMKMENELGSPRDGIVRAVVVSAGEAVEQGQLLVELE